jgi:aminopeptidase N
LLLHALRHEMGDEGFFVLVKAWAAEYRHSVVTTADFVALAEVYAGRSLGDFFARWLDSPRLPPLP